MDRAKEYLQAHKVHPSMQRILIMNYLLNNKEHPTADMIYSDLSKSMPTLSKTTVYNTLKVLLNNNAVVKLDIDAKEAHYDVYTHVHTHFKCVNCGRIIDLSLEYLDEIVSKGVDGLEITETQVCYKGYCSDCKNNRENPKYK